MNLFKSALAGLVLALCLFGTAVAGPYEDGQAAYDRGDYAAALTLLRPLADQGDASAQWQLAYMSQEGLGVSQDYVEAATWYRKAADQGNAPAQTNLGTMYYRGTGVPQDNIQAASWFRKAADQGEAHAQQNLGYMYRNGTGVPQDYDQAEAWYRKAADQGYASAQNELGFAYQNGQGVPQDYVQAVAWYRKAADQGDAYAQRNLGYMYGSGTGVPQDYAQGYKWISLSAARMEPGAERDNVARARDDIAARLDPVLLAQAQSEASSWQPTAAEVHADINEGGSSSPLVGILVLAGLLVLGIGGMIFLDRKKAPSTTLDSYTSAFATDGASRNAGSVEPVVTLEVGVAAAVPDSMPPPVLTEPQASPTADTDLKPRPWVRYGAKQIDIFCVSLLFSSLAILVFPSVFAGQHFIVVAFMSLIVWALVEPLVLSIFQTTPGRALFNTQLVYQKGQPIPLGAAYGRTLRVYIKGMGLGLPIIYLIAHVVAYLHLRKHGTTTWDRDGGFEVRHGKLSGLRITFIVLIFLTMAVLYLVSMQMMPGGIYPSPPSDGWGAVEVVG